MLDFQHGAESQKAGIDPFFWIVAVAIVVLGMAMTLLNMYLTKR